MLLMAIQKFSATYLPTKNYDLVPLQQKILCNSKKLVPLILVAVANNANIIMKKYYLNSLPLCFPAAHR